MSEEQDITEACELVGDMAFEHECSVGSKELWRLSLLRRSWSREVRTTNWYSNYGEAKAYSDKRQAEGDELLLLGRYVLVESAGVKLEEVQGE